MCWALFKINRPSDYLCRKHHVLWDFLSFSVYTLINHFIELPSLFRTVLTHEELDPASYRKPFWAVLCRNGILHYFFVANWLIALLFPFYYLTPVCLSSCDLWHLRNISGPHNCSPLGSFCLLGHSVYTWEIVVHERNQQVVSIKPRCQKALSRWVDCNNRNQFNRCINWLVRVNVIKSNIWKTKGNISRKTQIFVMLSWQSHLMTHFNIIFWWATSFWDWYNFIQISFQLQPLIGLCVYKTDNLVAFIKNATQEER